MAEDTNIKSTVDVPAEFRRLDEFCNKTFTVSSDQEWASKEMTDIMLEIQDAFLSLIAILQVMQAELNNLKSKVGAP